MKQDRSPIWQRISVFSDSRSIASAQRLLPIFLTFAGANIIFFMAIYTFFPDGRPLIRQEDNLVENCSVILYLSTFLLGLFKVFWGRNIAPSLLVVSGIAILGFLDELSYGERMFPLSMPSLFGVKIDAIHDLAFVARNFILGYVLTYPKRGFLALGGLVGLVIFLCWKWNSEIRTFVAISLRNPIVLFAFIFCTLGLTAVLIDLHLIESEYLYALEELFEMNAALCLFFLCASFRKRASKLM